MATEKTGIHKFIWDYTWVLGSVGLGLILLAGGVEGNKPANGSSSQMFIDLLGIIGLVLLVGAAGVFFAKRKLKNRKAQ